ncbi:hypothetical protein ACFSO7_00655 [Bacillus sp. CGMCC 1.16607]|uniref:hypothetical protein n=1 Tax=Bacillus sp. CGMCC 1.16607 TaxID=3351842 RepID=UPI0036371FA5
MNLILGIIICLYFIYEIVKVVFGLLTIGSMKKIKCKECFKQIDSSLIKCNVCGTFLDKKWKKQLKVMSYLENRHHVRMNNYIKRNNFFKGS